MTEHATMSTRTSVWQFLIGMGALGLLGSVFVALTERNAIEPNYVAAWVFAGIGVFLVLIGVIIYSGDRR